MIIFGRKSVFVFRVLEMISKKILEKSQKNILFLIFRFLRWS